jgi:hypothetical protein
LSAAELNKGTGLERALQSRWECICKAAPFYAGSGPKPVPARHPGGCRDNYEKIARRASYGSVEWLWSRKRKNPEKLALTS